MRRRPGCCGNRAFRSIRGPVVRHPAMFVGQLTNDPVRQTVGVHPALLALGIVSIVRRLPKQLQCDDDRVFYVRELDGKRALAEDANMSKAGKHFEAVRYELLSCSNFIPPARLAAAS
jgi:hypothetical protein